MTAQGLAGLAVLNVFFLAAGSALLWLGRGWRTWVEFGRLAGLAYVTGVVGVGSLWTLTLIVGLPFSLGIVLAVPAAVVVVGVLGGRRLARRSPELGAVDTATGLIVTAVGIAAAGLFLQAAFRGARLTALVSWDAWSFWVPKAKAIYFYGGLDEQFFTTLPGASYPPLVPVLDAAAFHLMGGPDVVTLHVQYWLFGLGFVWALAGLLSERAPAWILWPFVLLLLVAPRIGRRFRIPEADLLLDYLFVLAAVLVCFWLLDRRSWRLGVASVLLCGMVLTKREGVLLGALLLLAALLASGRELRATWRPLAFAAVAVAAVGAPWRIWYLAHDVTGEAPADVGLDPTEKVERLWPSMRLAFDVFLDTGYWSVIGPVAMGALVIAVLAKVRILPVFFGALVALVTLGGGWVTWAIPELPITQELGGNPIVRYMGAAALLCVAAAPLLLSVAWVTQPQGREPG